MTRLFTQYIPSNWLWLGVNIAALLPLIRLVRMMVDAPLSRGPVMFAPGLSQDIILFSGKTALILLVLSLVCTPAARIFNFNQVIKVRKSLGLWGFFYVCFHALYFMGGKGIFRLDSAAWWNVWQQLPPILSGLTKTPYAREGAYALALLALLALTSNRLSIRLLRKNWKRLHRLVYLAAPLAVYHYWRREEFAEAPAYWQPAIFGIAVGLLLLVRLPPVRRWLANLVSAWLPGERRRTERRIRTPQIVPRAPDRIVTYPPAQRFDWPDPLSANGGNGHRGAEKIGVEQQPVAATGSTADELNR